MSDEIWVFTGIAGWMIILFYFFLEFFEAKSGWKPISVQGEEKFRNLAGALGTFLVLLGYVMINL